MTSLDTSNWCILRTAGQSTLSVAASLAEAGFATWSPVETQKRRAPRSKAVRDVLVPITPGIVFAKADRLHDLVALARSPALTCQRWNAETKRMETRGCPAFSVFRHDGRFARVADRLLDPLRQAEQRAKPRSSAPVFGDGDQVRIPMSAFGGLVGIVESARRRTAMVRVRATTGEMLIAVDMCDLLSAQSAA